MTRAVDVAFLPAQARRADVTVVIDVLRATSTIVQAIEAGYRRVLCVDTLERARALAAPGRVLAGERQCVRPPGFDLGNSPVEMTPPRGDELVLATTNGAPAIVRAAALSPIVAIACLRNLDAVTEAAPPGDVQLLCAGTDGRPSLEDSYVAGRIAAGLGGRPSDSALIARALARAYASARAALDAGAGGRALAAAGLGSDIAWCAEESVAAVVPTLCETGDGLAIVHDGTRSTSAAPTANLQQPEPGQHDPGVADTTEKLTMRRTREGEVPPAGGTAIQEDADRPVFHGNGPYDCVCVECGNVLAAAMGPDYMTKRVRVRCGRCRTVNVAVFDAKGET